MNYKTPSGLLNGDSTPKWVSQTPPNGPGVVASAPSRLVGVLALDTGAVRLIPTATYAWTYQYTSGGFDNANIHAIGVGIGLVFNESITLTPGFLIPISEFDDSPSFAIVATFGF